MSCFSWLEIWLISNIWIVINSWASFDPKTVEICPQEECPRWCPTFLQSCTSPWWSSRVTLCGIFWDLLTVNFRNVSSVQMLRVGRGKCLLCKLVFLQFSLQTVGCRQYMEPRLLTNAVHPTTPSTTNTPKLYTAEQLRHFIFQQKWVNVVQVIKN